MCLSHIEYSTSYRIERKPADNYIDNFSSFCIDLIVLPRLLLLCNDWRDVFCCSCKATLLVIITQPYLSTLWLFALIEEKPRSPTFSCNFCNRRLSRKLNALVPAAAKLISELWLRIFVIGQGGGALALGLKALYRKCNAQKSLPFLGYYERHKSIFRPEWQHWNQLRKNLE